jgi:hypothetical protein
VKTLGHLNLIGRALLANFVIIPIIGIFIARFFDLPPEMRRLFFYFLTEKERDRRVFVLAGPGTVQIVQMVESRLHHLFS